MAADHVGGMIGGQPAEGGNLRTGIREGQVGVWVALRG